VKAVKRGMNDLYFKNEDHTLNYRKLTYLFPKASLCSKMRSVIYITALPEIYNHVSPLLEDYQTPIDWMLDWIEIKNSVDAGLIHPSFLPFELSTSVEQLGNFALHLWNGTESFNLMNCLQSIDDKNLLLCLIEAISIRIQVN